MYTCPMSRILWFFSQDNYIHISYDKRIFLSEKFGAWKTKHIPFKPRW